MQNAMTRDGEDPSIMDLDPEKSVASQLNNKEEELVDKGPPLKEDPKYVKFFKMLKMVSGIKYSCSFIMHVTNQPCLTLALSLHQSRVCQWGLSRTP